MNLDTNGYVANGVYDNIRGMGNYGTAFDMDAHSYEQTQAIKDQATLLNLYQDNKGERRSDRVDDKICDADKDGIKNTTAILQKLSDCCCENKVALTALNGKVDLNAERTTNAILQSEMRTNAKMDSINLANVERLLHQETLDNGFNKRGQFIASYDPCRGK